MTAAGSVHSSRERQLIRRILFLSSLFAFIALLIPVLIFFGELTNFPRFHGGHPALPALHFLTTVGLFFSAIAALLTREDKLSHAKTGVARLLALLVALIGLTGFVDFISDGPLELATGETEFAEDVTPLISISFLLFGSAVLLLHQRRLRLFYAQLITLLVVAISIFVLNRYMFTISDIQLFPIEVSAMGMSLLTATTFAILSFSLLCSHPKAEFMSLVTSGTRSAEIARNILITAVFAPPFIGILTRIGVEFGWYDLSVQFGIFSIVITALIFRITWRAVRRAEEEEIRGIATLNALKTLNANLRKTIEEKRLFVSLVENSNDFIAIADSNGKPWYLNPAGRRLVGLPADFPVGKLDRLDFYPPEQRDFVKNIVYKECLLKGHWSGRNYLLNHQTKEAITVSDEHFAIFEMGTDRLIATCAICRDITEHVRRENQLRVVAKTSIELSRVFKIEEKDKKIASLLVPDVADGAAIGKGIPLDSIDVSHADSRFENLFNEFAEKILKGEIDLEEHRTCIDEGVPVIIEDFASIRDKVAEQLNGSPELNAYLKEIRSVAFIPLTVFDRVIGSIAVVADVSKRRFLHSDMDFFKALSMRFAFFIENTRLISSLQEAVKVREDVLSVVSHDLKNPVAAIALAVQLLRSLKAGEMNRLRELTDKIQRAVDQIQDLILGLLDFAKIRSGTFAIESFQENLNNIIVPVVDVLRLQAEAKRQSLILDLPADLPKVACDAKRLGQVIMNILGNAIKFTPEGGRIEIKARLHDSAVCVSVSDTGPGIAPEDVERIFDRFWQAKRAKHLGTGLGLAIAKGIILAHGGQIWAESEIGKGSTFFFTVPLAQPDTPKKPIEESPHEAAIVKPALYGVRILLVDDSVDMLSLLARLLENAGAKVMIASNVSLAFDLFLRERPDVVVTDIEMPGEGGIDLIEKIQRLGPEKGGHIPVAALTAHGRDEELRKIDEAGFDMKLFKPIDVPELIAAVSKLAAMSRSYQRAARFREWTGSP